MSENNVNEEELEQLIKIAKTPTKEKIKPITDYSDAYQFTLEFKIEPGKEEVQAKIVYNLYTKWKGNKAVTRTRFFRDFHQYFPRKKKATGTFYLLNYTAIGLEKIVSEKLNE